MLTIPQLIKALGGPTKVAKKLGIGTSAVTEMTRRETIPIKYWPKLCNMASKTTNLWFISYGTFAEMHLAAARKRK